jgi:2,3-bisphosphoglycerate-independent phosphoglycerate mutase
VPLVVSGAGVTSDGSERYGERASAKGSLGSLRGVEIVPRLVELLGR